MVDILYLLKTKMIENTRFYYFCYSIFATYINQQK